MAILFTYSSKPRTVIRSLVCPWSAVHGTLLPYASALSSNVRIVSKVKDCTNNASGCE